MGPIDYEPEENMPPEILSHTDGTLFCDEQTLEDMGDDILCIASSQQLVFVTAVDPDGDLLEFNWDGTGSGRIGNAVTTYSDRFQNSQVTLSRDQVVDGEEIHCTISDGSNDIGQSWTVVVL